MSSQTDRSAIAADLGKLRGGEPFLWLNPRYCPDARSGEAETCGAATLGSHAEAASHRLAGVSPARGEGISPAPDSGPADSPRAGWSRHRLGLADVLDADARWRRFAPLLARLFPELGAAGGIIESPLVEAPRLSRLLAERDGVPIAGRLFVKHDGDLPVAGSIKARGGIYAVLRVAEQVATRQSLLPRAGTPYTSLAEPAARAVFARHELSVGSTGNLGMSIGIMGSALGFAVTVHMSRDAKPWKKSRLRSLGVNVVEHAGDYTAACAEARRLAEGNPRIHFIDDENSLNLFLGYSAAALRIADQLRATGVEPGRERPLFVYLPCGVGGAPGGITFGLKQLYGPAVHCFFAEPTGAPCMTLGLMTGRHGGAALADEGITLSTDADGLAVPRPSQFVGRLMEPLLSGCYTLSDERMCRHVAGLYESEGLRVELSAAACCEGPRMLLGTPAGGDYLRRHGLESRLPGAAHVIWTTGGKLLPEDEFGRLLDRARKIRQG